MPAGQDVICLTRFVLFAENLFLKRDLIYPLRPFLGSKVIRNLISTLTSPVITRIKPTDIQRLSLARARPSEPAPSVLLQIRQPMVI